MDSIDSIYLKKKNEKSYINPNLEINKKTKLKDCIDIKLLILCLILISNLYLVYLFKTKYNCSGISFTRLDSGKNDSTFSPQSLISNISKYDKENKTERFIKESYAIQKDFCDNPNKYLNENYENMIKLTDFTFKNIEYQMYVYKEGDNYMSNFIIRTKGYVVKEMTNFYEALEYYGKKNNILNKKDIYMLDLGGNLGIYPSYFGRLGYTVISFEASPRNYYIMEKNYCQINRNSENIIIINRGVSNQEKICNYYTQITGLGNGMLKCDENKESLDNDGFHWIKTFEVPMIKLSSFIPYFANKNLALIKLDIEGSEALVMQDAIEFITKYHIPYIYSEFSINMIKEHGNNPIEYINLFTNNGYKVNTEGFLSKNFIPPEKVSSGNLYFTYYGN